MPSSSNKMMAIYLGLDREYLTEDGLCDTMGNPFDESGDLSEHGQETLADMEERGDFRS